MRFVKVLRFLALNLITSKNISIIFVLQWPDFLVSLLPDFLVVYTSN
jgi:hypothetical protein